MGISKSVRQEVYDKYNGRCAYCGREIAYKDMQVDHFIPKRGWDKTGSDDISNLVPACRTCNHYKRANSLEIFRKYIEEIPKKLRQNYIYKVGLAYGNVLENEGPVVFYFEQVEAEKCRHKTAKNDSMTPKEAWSIISKNMMELYARRRAEKPEDKAYSDKEVEAEVICFKALQDMTEILEKEKRNDL